MRNLYTLTFILFTISLHSQQGDFLLTEHLPRASNLDNSNFEIINDWKGRICIANRSGVLKYDGEAWDFYKTPSAALSLAVDTSNVVYVGGINSVGKIDFADGKIQFQSLIQQDTLQDLFLETFYVNEKVYFVGNKMLLTYNTSNNAIQQFLGEFLNAYILEQEVFINSVDGQTFLVSDSLQKVNPNLKIAYAHQKGESPVIALNFYGKLFTYENFDFKELPQNRIIKEGGYEIQEVQWINESLFVCSTFESGLLFFDINKPGYVKVSDYYSGLPDNEIFALHTDNFNGVWAAHEFGITQISPLFPAFSYAHFPGLSGNLTSTHFYKDELWVTTSIGLFYFNRDTIFETKVYYETISNEKKKADKPTPEKEVRQKQADQKISLKRIFGKKKRATEDTEEKEPKGFLKSISGVFEKKHSGVDKVKGKLNKNTRYIRRTKKIPVDFKYGFKQIEGANGKFLSIIPYQDRLLAVSTSGIYEIKGNAAELIIKDNIQTFTLNKQNQLIVSTSDLQVKFYKLLEDVWVEQYVSDTDDIIVQMKEDSNNNLWLAGSNTIFKAKSTDSTFQIENEYPLHNNYLDKVSFYEINEKKYFINSQGYFYYNEEKDEVVEDQELRKEIGIPSEHLYDPYKKSLWVFNGKYWIQIQNDGTTIKDEYLGLFPDLRAIHSKYHSPHLWLVTKDNDILKYDPREKSDLEDFNLFLRKVSNEKTEYDESKKFSLSYDENYLSVVLSKPDFLGLLNPEFQYKLVGLHTEWSDWSKSKTIDFSYLPEGNYELLVKSRDAFGRIDEGSMLQFSVKPPYWQTPWFYAIQIIFFGGLVLLSTRLNQDNSKNRLLSGGLTILTLVLIIEFLQSAISSYFTFKSTPVVDFLIDAMIAFMIFPLERVLRELMTEGKVKVKVKKKSQLADSTATTE